MSEQAIQAGVMAGQTTAAIAGASIWVPVIGGAVAGVTWAIGHFLKRGRQKRAASQVADEIERLMQDNLNAFLSSSRSEPERQQALQNFDALWDRLVEVLSELGSPGQQGIIDRAREPQLGDRLPNVDWFALYRDPIANAPQKSDGVSLLPLIAGVLLLIGLVKL